FAGVALFFSYLALAELDGSAPETAREFLEKAMDSVAEEPMNPSLFSGFTGVAWLAAHLRKHLLELSDDTTEAIDDALHNFLRPSPWKGEFDLINGLVGFGAYAVERLPNPAGARLLGRIIDCLGDCSRPVSGGRTWWTDPRWLGSPS